MKKILTLFTLISLSFGFQNNIFADGVKVTATVWNETNNAPILSSITPAYSPVVIKWYTIQSFSMRVKDAEWWPVTYTITPESWRWSVNVTSWILSNEDRLKSWESTVYFKYLAPANFTWNTTLIITLNDGRDTTTPQWEKELTIYKINLYIY